jgi:hypothetical protein
MKVWFLILQLILHSHGSEIDSSRCIHTDWELTYQLNNIFPGFSGEYFTNTPINNMTVRLLAQAPFNYSYKSKVRHFLTGDSYHLNPDVPDEKAELEYVLSPHFPHREYIYLFEHPFIASYQAEINKSIYLDPAPSAAAASEYVPAVESATPNEPTHELTSELNVVPQAEAESAEEIAVPPENAPIDRFNELSSLTVKQLRELAGTLGIEYRSKQLTIEEIIAREANGDSSQNG